MMRRFKLVRNEDVTGLTGIGIIAEGVTTTGGGAFLHWMTEHETFVYWPGGVDAILAVHGHSGATVARYIDELPGEMPYEPPTGTSHPEWDDLLAGQTPPPPVANDNEPTTSLWELHDDPEMNR